MNTNHDEEIKDTVRQQHAEVERVRNGEELEKIRPRSNKKAAYSLTPIG